MENNNIDERNDNISLPDFDQFSMLSDKSIEKFLSLTKNQPELLREIMQSFLDESSELIESVEDSIKKSDFDKFSQYIHTLKGLFGTIGALKLFEILKYIDDNNKKENFDVASKLLPQVKSNYKELHVIIKEKFLE